MPITAISTLQEKPISLREEIQLRAELHRFIADKQPVHDVAEFVSLGKQRPDVAALLAEDKKTWEANLDAAKLKTREHTAALAAARKPAKKRRDGYQPWMPAFGMAPTAENCAAFRTYDQSTIELAQHLVKLEALSYGGKLSYVANLTDEATRQRCTAYLESQGIRA